MKALVLEAYNKFTYTDVPEPAIEPDHVLIRVHSCGICGSDIHGMDGSTGRRQPPVIMGHEAAGSVMEAGPGVDGSLVGQRVTFDSTVYCGRCWYCTKGLINLCDNRRVLGVSCDDYRMNGAFAEIVSVPVHVVYPIPDALAFEDAVFVEPLAVAFHAVRRSRLSVGQSAAVVGTGMVGLLVVQVLKAAGCAHIVAVDLDSSKRAAALAMGADTAVDPSTEEPFAAATKVSGGRGVDHAFEVVGVTAAVKTAASMVRKGGTLTLVGNISAQVEFPLQAVVTRGISVNGSCASRGEYPECIQMLADGSVDVKPLASACAPLSEGAEWFKRLYDGEKGLFKVILQP